MIFEWYKGKRVLVTGHTGFKGSWLCTILKMAGAQVIGYSLKPPTNPNLYEAAKAGDGIRSAEGDIRDLEKLKKVFAEYKPEVVFHLAAQPIVREGYTNPIETYEINVMGTANILECVRLHSFVQSVVNVTTDKVYENKEWEWGYRENDRLDGFDPYSNSKSCSELITHSYKNSFLQNMAVKVSTARAGNVIGGGDFAKARIIPDCVRAMEEGKKIIIRNPYSIRPYQHVLEALHAYLMIAALQVEQPDKEGYYNVGPDDCDCITTGQLATIFCHKWGQDASWEAAREEGPHEASFLKLDCSKIKNTLGWKPRWNIEKAVSLTVDWSKIYLEGNDVKYCMEQQIKEFYR